MELVRLAQVLVELLNGHGVEAALKDDLVYLPTLDRWANLWMHESEGGGYLIEVRATAPAGVVIADRCAAIGATVEAARSDGLQSFCLGTFHVLLASLWGVLELDQVEYEILRVGHRAWDLYLGPCTLRSSDGVEPLVLPQRLVELVPEYLTRRLTDDRVHVVRLYLAVLNGAVTIEALFDDQEDPALGELFANAEWQLPRSGFASIRWFIAVSPQMGGPSHLVERSGCGG